jgi:hypothetical protein
MTVANSGVIEFDLAVRAVKPASTILVPAGLETDGIPLLATLSFDVDAPLSEVLAKFAARWPRPYEVDLVLEDKETGVRTFPDLAARVDTLDLAHNYVIVTHPRPTEVLVESNPVRAPVHEEDESEAVILRTGSVRVNREQPSGVTYSFSCEQRQDEFSLSFERGKTVGDARNAVAAHYSLDSEFVTLLHAGKPLKDGFLLDRLRIGRQAIRIYLKGASEVLLLTAAAMLH